MERKKVVMVAEASLQTLLPVIRRARGYRLYAQDGRRYLDLWQGGGRAILGHRPARVTTVLKNVISTGLISDLPSVYTGRLERELGRYFPAHPHFRLAGSLGSALELASLYLGRALAAGEPRDPLSGVRKARREAALWRPLLDAPVGATVLLPLLPFCVAGAPVPVGFVEPPPADFPPSELISPMVLAGALRALHDLKRHSVPQWLRPDLLRGARGWRQTGPYVTPEFPEARYRAVFSAFLAEGVLLNPSFAEPSVLPSEASAGEVQKMMGLCRRFPGK
jgi:hypothetical protein